MKLLLENWRKYLNEETADVDFAAERQLIEEGKIGDFIQKHKAKVKDALQRLANEIKQTTNLGKLLLKGLSKKELNAEEKSFMKEQMKDILGGVFLLGIFLLPGGALAAGVLVKLAQKFNVELLPDSFTDSLPPVEGAE